MKPSKTLTMTLILLLMAVVLMAGDDKAGQADDPAEEKEIHWYDYDNGLSLAKEGGKHLFVNFTTSWCGYCKKMDKEAFADSAVINLLNTDFVPVKVDGDSKKALDIDGYKTTERDLSRKEFRVRGYPTFWFLKSDGSKLANLRGYQTKDYLMQALTYVKEYKYDTTKTSNTEENN